MHLDTNIPQMNVETVEDGPALPDVIVAPRTDSIYNAHGYLTKVPVDAITPFICAFTKPGELVVDMFAGSGMTAVASRIAGRNAVVSDISALGRHIGEGYLIAIDHADFRSAADAVIRKARARLADLYTTQRSDDGATCEFVRTIWSFVYKCANCGGQIVYFEALAASEWKQPTRCPHCDEVFQKKGAAYVGEVPVRVVVDGTSGRQVEQMATDYDRQRIAEAGNRPELRQVPSATIDSHREMYKRSALKKWGLEETKQFFSDRNALALYFLWHEIHAIAKPELVKKLMFAFTAVLPRASRRYQWSPQRPLNAATQNYYIAPVYFEWNVFQLFDRKIEATIRSDLEITTRSLYGSSALSTSQKYVVASAAKLSHLSDESVDYVFTDPPFGSNLFYADMNLFQEAWLESHTDDSDEAVIHTNRAKGGSAANRYEGLLREALQEAFRVLRPGRHLSLVFGNSSGKIWSMVQRILRESGFERRPVHIGILDKGQRSVKGLNSGTESVATLDLVVTLRKPGVSRADESAFAPTIEMSDLVRRTLDAIDVQAHPTPSHVYLSILKKAFEAGLAVDSLHLSDIQAGLRDRGLHTDSKTGLLEVA